MHITDVEFEKLLIQYQPVLHGFAFGKKIPDAEDFVQDILLMAWRLRGSYDPSRGGIAFWLKYLCRDHYRNIAVRAKRMPNSCSINTGREGFEPPFNEDHDWRIDLEDVKDLLRYLVDGDLLWRFVNGEQMKLMGVERGISTQAIEQRIRKVRGNLARILDGEDVPSRSLHASPIDLNNPPKPEPKPAPSVTRTVRVPRAWLWSTNNVTGLFDAFFDRGIFDAERAATKITPPFAATTAGHAVSLH